MVQFIRKKKRQELFQMNPLFFPTLDKYNEFQLTLLLICVFPIFQQFVSTLFPETSWLELELEQNFKS